MAGPIAGGCACGAVRYRSDADPMIMLNCHCRDCQRATGGGYAAIVVVPKASVKLDGAPKYHRGTADSGNGVQRGFCAACGSPIAITLDSKPEIFGVFAGSLVTALATGRFHLEGFQSPRHMLRSGGGAALMGAGGVMAFGCSVGQGLTGFSTLALASLIAFAGILLGTAAGLRGAFRVRPLATA